MNVSTSWSSSTSNGHIWSALLVLGLGLAVVWTGVAVLGPASDSTAQYVGYEIGVEDDELVLVDPERQGDEAIAQEATQLARTTNVDDRVVCAPDPSMDCGLYWDRYRADGALPGGASRYDYALFADGFYRIEPRTSAGAARFVPTDAGDALDDLAIDSDTLTSTERAAVDDGIVVTTRTLPNANTVIEHEGSYYTIRQTAEKRGGFCQSTREDDFCDDADSHRTWLRLQQGAVVLFGLAGVVVGGRRSYVRLRATDTVCRWRGELHDWLP